MPIPSPVLWKIYRSKVHLEEFQTAVEEFFKSNPAKIVQEPGGDPDQFVGTFQATSPIPGRLPIIIGDCLQNLRSALDYLVWELVLVAKNEPGRHNMFPICSTEGAFEQQVSRNRLQGVTTDAIAEIESWQPYHLGPEFDKSMLWILDDLCNINKHRRVLLTNIVGGPSDLELQTINGQLFGRVDFRSIKKDARIGPFSIVDGPQGRGVQVDVNPNVAAYLAFDEGGAQSMDVGFVVSHVLRLVTVTVLPRFERFFAQAQASGV